MRRGAITLAMSVLLLGLLSVARTATSQEPIPTPRGQLGGRPPLELTPALPVPTQSASPTPAATPPPPATPVASPMGTPSGTPVGTPVRAGYRDVRSPSSFRSTPHARSRRAQAAGGDGAASG